MALILSISSDTVDSHSSHLPQLFSWHTQAIELGNLRSIHDYIYISDTCKRVNVSLGIHSPFMSIDDRYGLLWGTTYPWQELERNLVLAQKDKLSYVIVHFPYIWDASRNLYTDNLSERVIEAAIKMRELVERYQVPIVCEPILGPNKDPRAFSFLMHQGTKFIEKCSLKLCIDLGYIYLAARRLSINALDIVNVFSPFCLVMHLHHVWHGGRKYFWTPVAKQGNVPLLEAIKLVDPSSRDIYAVLEHTPHRIINRKQVVNGLNWLLNSTGPWKGRDNYPTYDGKYKRIH
jgi:hypothetical protein